MPSSLSMTERTSPNIRPIDLPLPVMGALIILGAASTAAGIWWPHVLLYSAGVCLLAITASTLAVRTVPRVRPGADNAAWATRAVVGALAPVLVVSAGVLVPVGWQHYVTDADVRWHGVAGAPLGNDDHTLYRLDDSLEPRISAVDLATGRTAWSVPAPTGRAQDIRIHPIADGGVVISQGGQVRSAVDARGHMRWRGLPSGIDKGALPVASQGGVLVLRICSIRGTTCNLWGVGPSGKLAWHRVFHFASGDALVDLYAPQRVPNLGPDSLPTTVALPLPSAGTDVDSDSGAVVVDPRTGKVQTTYRDPVGFEPSYRSVIAVGDTVLVSSGCDRLVWPHRDGLIWPHLRLAGAVMTV